MEDVNLDTYSLMYELIERRNMKNYVHGHLLVFQHLQNPNHILNTHQALKILHLVSEHEQNGIRLTLQQHIDSKLEHLIQIEREIKELENKIDSTIGCKSGI